MVVAVAAEAAVVEAAAVGAKTKRLDLQIKNVLLTAERFLFITATLFTSSSILQT
jgi:hypothetical protein